MNIRFLNMLASVTLIALIVLGVAWEQWLAPLRPGGSTLVFKVLPLLAALFGILHGKRYTYQWSSLLALLYLMEGLVRATSERGLSVTLAWLEVLFSSLFFVACLLYSRQTRPSRLAQQGKS